MDGLRFDTLTRTLAATGTRRHALATALSGALSTALSVSVIDEAAAKKKCPPCKKRKRGKCKNTKPNGTACPGGTCQGGRCIPAPTCSDGIKNGNETGVDCGGSCPRCSNGQGCASRNDCASALCRGGTCQACTEIPDNCGDVNGAACFCTGGPNVCNNGVTSGPVPECEACPPDTICIQDGAKRFCAERCGAA
jgi:hypothetical protein